MQYYDTSIQDVPIKDLRESKVRTYTDYDTFRRNTEMKRYNNNSTTAVNQGWTYENTTNQ
jgi:hypothetical protein